uniref:Uncharacterized protein n=1 Tax=Alexandrium monilatum TaxID=311494 RepID=A0A7S4PV38_9DINO
MAQDIWPQPASLQRHPPVPPHCCGGSFPTQPFSPIPAMAASTAALKKEWNACLAKTGGNPGRCEKLEKDLRASSKATGVDCCIDETIKLMRCTTSSSRADGCSDAFIAMRECNRAGGKQLLAESGAYAVAPGKQGLFTSEASSLVSTSGPPQRTLKGMTEFGQEYAKSLGIMPGEVRF